MLTAIITGVSRGLGEALALELLARECRVLGMGRSSSGRLGGERYGFVACDLANVAGLPAIVRPAFDAVAARRPTGLCLINNAATLDPVGVLGTAEASDIAASIAVNLIAPIVLSGLFCRVFDDDAIGRRIVNISSGAAQSTLPGESLYCIGKAGLEMLTRSLAAEHTSPRFRAITVRPGVIDTAMQSFARAQPKDLLPSVELFKGFHADARLVPPEIVARKLVERLVLAAVDHGRTYSYAEL
jgi:benzil reductase ((S)-benzoin forming)